MKYVDWNTEKNEWLQLHRGISFEEVLVAMENDQILELIEHPNQQQYPDQNIMVINLYNYAYAVPYVEDDEKIFLKTIYPSRKYTKQYFE